LVVDVSEKVREIMLASILRQCYCRRAGENLTHFYDTSITTLNTTAHLRSHSRYEMRAVENIATPNAAATGVDALAQKSIETQNVSLIA